MGNAMKPKDFEGIGSAFNHDKERTAEALKKASKAIFTPGTYGSNIHAAVWGEHTADPGRLASGGADNAAKILQTSGMTKELANKAAAQMAENFRSSPLYQFNSAFKGIMKHAPEGFVYTNPLSGFHMNFDKFKTTEAKISVNPKTGKEYKSRQTLQNSIRMPVVDKTSGKPVEGVKQVAFPYARAERDSRGSASGAAALFIQNWDSAIMSKLGTDLKSPHTLHDAIAVPKGKEQKAALAKAVANAYNRTAKIDPIGNLVNQIKDTLKHRERLSAPKGSKPSKAYLKKIAALDAALKHFRSLSQQKPSASTGHNLAGINVPSDNAHFVEE
jgi:hypothetical protein